MIWYQVKWLADNLLLEEHQLRKVLTRHPQARTLLSRNGHRDGGNLFYLFEYFLERQSRVTAGQPR